MRAIFNLEIKKKSGLSLNPDILHSKVFSSALIGPTFLRDFYRPKGMLINLFQESTNKSRKSVKS